MHDSVGQFGGVREWDRSVKRFQESFLDVEPCLAVVADERVCQQIGVLPGRDAAIKKQLEAALKGITIHRRVPRRSLGYEAVPRVPVVRDEPRF